MKYTSTFAEQVQQLDLMVIIQKELDLYEHKKRHFRKMIALHYNDRIKERVYQKEYREVVKQMKLLEAQMPNAQEFINCPRIVISRYMEVYQVSIKSVAMILHISTESIHNYLRMGYVTSESKTFIYWAIRNLRLDANRYWNLIQKEAI